MNIGSARTERDVYFLDSTVTVESTVGMGVMKTQVVVVCKLR